MRGGTAAFVGLLGGGVVACTGWVEDDALAVPEAPIPGPMGFHVVPTEPAGATDEPTEHEVLPPRDPAPRCVTTMEYMESEDGTTPRQRAMFAPEAERRPWATMREWFAGAGVSLPEEAGMYAFGGAELSRALGDPSAHYDCARIVELAGQQSVVCTRSAIVEHAELQGRDVLAVDWVIVLATAEG